MQAMSRAARGTALWGDWRAVKTHRSARSSSGIVDED
jgi:hypothetical protein